MTQPKVSVIVPIYGVEKYIHQCIDSILNQTLEDIEILLIDDGSKDNCPAIIDEYAKQDSRIKAIHQENGGYGKAVNNGLSKAIGEYIAIVEPDDFIEQNMFEVLYDDAKQNDVDVVKGPYYDYSDDDNDREICVIAKRVSPPKNPFNIFEYPTLLTNHASIWTGLYRRQFIRDNNITVLELNKGRYADQNWRFKTLMLAKNIYWEAQPFYNYRTTNADSSSFKKNNPDDVFEIYGDLDDFFASNGRFDAVLEYLYKEKYNHMTWNMERVDEKYTKYCLDRMHKVFITFDKNRVLNSSIFSRKEKQKFLSIYSNKYYQNYLFKKFIQWIFSLTNKNKYKVLILFGIEIKLMKLKRTKKDK